MTEHKPRWVDFHWHLDLYADLAAMIAESERERVATLAVTTTPKAWPRNRELAEGSRHVRVGLGAYSVALGRSFRQDLGGRSSHLGADRSGATSVWVQARGWDGS